MRTNNLYSSTVGTNSRANSQSTLPVPTLKVDYLAIHYSVTDRDQFLAIAEHLTMALGDCVLWDREQKNTKYGRVWNFGYYTARGGRVLCNSEGTNLEFCMVLKGDSLELATVEKLRTVLKEYHRYYTHCSRSDLALDFYPQARELRDEMQAALSDHRVGHIKKYATHATYDLRTDQVFSTLAIGGRDSDLFARLYDKELEGKDTVRIELELKRDLANFTYNALLESDIALAQAYLGFWARVQFFVDKVDKNLQRNQLTPFFQQFLDSAESIRISTPRKIDSLTRSINWLDRQVSKTLAKLANFFPVDRFHDLMRFLLDSGQSKLSKIDSFIVAENRNYCALHGLGFDTHPYYVVT